jgi:predicted nucleic acid-binding protein
LYGRWRIRIGYLIDTWAGVEYYYGHIPKIQEYIENDTTDLFTSVLTLTEMVKFLRQKEDASTVQNVIRERGIRSLIIPVRREIAILAGNIRVNDFWWHR